MTSLLRDLALEKEDFSEQQHEELLIVNEREDYEEQYNELVVKYNELEVTHHKTLGEVGILKDTVNTLREDYEEANKHIARIKDHELQYHELEETNAELREECEKHILALRELQECHKDLEHSLSDSSTQVHLMELEKKKLHECLQQKDDAIAKLEKELCNIDKAMISNRTEISEDTGCASDKKDDPSNEENIANNPNEISLEEQIKDLKECTRRSTSRLSFLSTRLAARDDTITKLQNRIEEVVAERDSFREALQMSFVTPASSRFNSPQTPVSRSVSDSAVNLGVPFEDSESSTPMDSKNSNFVVTDHFPIAISNSDSSGDEISSPSQSGNLSKSTALSTIETPDDGNLGKKSPSGASTVLGNWQSTVAAATGLTTDGLKGVTSSLGSYLYTPGSGGSNSSNLNGLSHHHKQYILHLEKKIQVLQKKNKELTELKALIPLVEDLREKLKIAEDASKETDKWADEEFSTLSKNIDELKQLKNEAILKYQQSQEVVEDLNLQISRTANTYSNFEEKLREKSRQVQIVEDKLKAAKENSVPLSTHREAQDRISSLQGEAKHWQNKAQSLSKEMQRLLSMQVHYDKKKEEIVKMERKIEELEVERQNFRQAMQDIMLSQTNMELQFSNGNRSERNESKAFSWFGNNAYDI